MDTKKLRLKILDLAIHGRLVPQDPSDEPAIEHLKRICPGFTPCDNGRGEMLPQGWCISRLKELCAFLSRGKSPKYSDIDRTIPVFAQKCNLKGGGISLEQAKFLDPSTIGKWSEVYKLRTGDILINSTGTGTVGRTRLFKESCLGEYPFVLPDSHISVVRAAAGIIPQYLFAYITSNKIQYYIEDNLAGSTNQKELYIGVLEQMEIFVPPLPEQHRIVAEIEKWFALIDQIEQGKASLQNTIKQTKSKILDLAIHGRLVPQDPNDEPAIELLKRINPGFAPCDNGHDKKLPQNWTWAKGTNIFLPMKSTKPKDEQFQYIDIDSIDNKRQIISGIKTIKTINAPSRASRYIQKNDVIFSMVRPYLRNIAKVNKDNCIASTGFYVCSPNPRLLNSDYCFYLMISDYVVNGLNQFMKGDNSPSINKVHIDEWLFPLPPLPEQHRIAAKIEELFSALDNIQKALEA